MKYQSFSTKIPSYRPSLPPHYKSCCIISNDRINATNLYDALCNSNPDICGKLYPINIELWRRNIYHYKEYLNCLYHLNSDYFKCINKKLFLKNNAFLNITLNLLIMFKY